MKDKWSLNSIWQPYTDTCWQSRHWDDTQQPMCCMYSLLILPLCSK